MNILPSIYRESTRVFEQTFLPALTAQLKKIYVAALIAVSCIAACYMIYYCIKNRKITLADDLQNVPVKEPQVLPVIRKEARQEYQEGIKAFSFEVLQNRIAESKTNNQLISPLGISFLLSMIKDGVGPEDQAEIERIIHLPKDSIELKVSAFELIKKLKANGLDVAGLLYLNHQYRLNPDYQSQASQYYQSQVASGNSAMQVNSWVQKVTNGQIQEIITQDDLTDFFLLLANAIHFKADWAEKFEREDTRPSFFYGPSGGFLFKKPGRLVDMMHKTDKVEYFEDDNCQAIKLSYEDKRGIAMMLILPKKDKDNDFSFIDASTFDAISKNMTSQMVKIALPKFKLEQEVDVMKLLKGMGMDHLFNAADFCPLVDLSHPASKDVASELYISKMKQKSVLACDEKGTEASTVTVAVMVKECAIMYSEPPKKIEFDRPFLAALVSDETPVLFGVIRNPSDKSNAS